MKNDTITALLIHQVTAKEAYKMNRAKCTTEQAVSYSDRAWLENTDPGTAFEFNTLFNKATSK